MEIKIDTNFTMKTFAGFFTYCNAGENFYRDFRDVDTVEKAVKYVKTILNHKELRDLMITFTYGDDIIYAPHATSRLCYDMGLYRLIKWDYRGNLISEEKLDKVTTKLIRELYLECADKAIEMEKASA